MVIGTVEEEATSKGARHLARAISRPRCAIIGEPSGWDGITIGYKGILSMDYLLKQPAGHGADGRATPAEQAVGFYNRPKSYADQHNTGVASRFAALDPSLAGMHTWSDGLEAGVSMNFSLRIPPGFPISSLRRKMRTWSAGARLVLRDAEAAVEAARDTEVVRALLRSIRAEGGRPCFKLKTGTSDMNILAPGWCCPIVAYGPGDPTLDHTPNEHPNVEEFRRGVDVLARALDILCCQSARVRTVGRR